MDSYSTPGRDLQGMTMAHPIPNANQATQSKNISIERHLQEYQTSTPWSVNPGAPILGSTSSPFVFSPFDPSPVISRYPGEPYENETEPSLSTGTSANSSVVMTTPFHSSSDRSLQRVMYHALTPPRYHLRAESGVRSPIGLGLLGLFKEDGTPFDGLATITQEVDEEIYPFLDDFCTCDSSGGEDEDEDEYLSATLVDCSPSPRLLDDVFSALAPVRVSPTLRSRFCERGSNSKEKNCGPEEPEYDDVFIERGRLSRDIIQAD